MRKKILILLMLVIPLTGCTVNYNLEVNTDGFQENFAITAYETEEVSKEALYGEYLDEYPIYINEEFLYYDPTQKLDDYTYYNKTYQELDNGYIFNYSTSYKYGDFQNARSINTFFGVVDYGYVRDEDYYYLSFSKPLLFKENNNFEQASININFASDYIVLSSNANRTNGNTYTWVINDEADSINIKYNLKTNNSKPDDQEKEEEPKEESWASKHIDIIIGIAFIVLFGGIVIVSRLMVKKR